MKPLPFMKRLAPGVGLIVLVSAVLLLSDLPGRRRAVNRTRLEAVSKEPNLEPADARKTKTGTGLAVPAPGQRSSAAAAARQVRIGVVYFGPEPATEAGLKGFMDALSEAGYRRGENLEADIRHAQGEMVNIPSILQFFMTRNLDLVVPLTTPCLTAACGMIKKTPVVFSVVSDPIAAGAGVDFNSHQPNVTGVGSFPPVKETLDRIRAVIPNIKAIGTLYNSAEANSRRVIAMARDLIRPMSIRLEEVTVSNTNEVYQAAQALTQRRIQAVWVTSDNTAFQAFDAIVSVMEKAGLPLFINEPSYVAKGALMAVGPEYYTSGFEAGRLAARVLGGESPAAIPFENVAENQVVLNHGAAKRLGLTFPDPVIREATPAAAKIRKVILAKYMESSACEESEAGVMEGLEEAGLEQGRDLALKIRSAQGDMTALNTIMDAAATENTDLVITLSTPTLQAAIRRMKRTSVVFTHVADPFTAGAGRNAENHLPNVTGTYNLCDYGGLLRIVKESIPSARCVGTVFTPSEANSAFHHNRLVEAGGALGLEVIGVGASNPSEVGAAAQSLASRGIDALCQITDNLCDAAFPAIAEAARMNRLPLFGFAGHQIEQGAVLVLARDFRETGHAAGLIAARVLRGEDPATIPFTVIRESRLQINLKTAETLGIRIPSHLLDRAEKVYR
jgi:ABC-type uncharacterized transport system substrate-binding protein